MQSGMAQSKEELGGLKKRIQEEKKLVTAIRNKESSVMSQLNEVDRNLAKREKELKKLKQKLASVTRKARQTNEELQLITQAVESQQGLLEKRLVAL